MMKSAWRIILVLIFASFIMAQVPGGHATRDADIISLREYIDLRFEVTQRAIDKAEATMNDRLRGMNEFRDTLKDQATKFITRDELLASLFAVAGLVLGIMTFIMNRAKNIRETELRKRNGAS